MTGKRLLYKECNKRAYRINSLPNYSFLSILLRLIINIVTAVILLQFVKYVVTHDNSELYFTHQGPELMDYLRIIFYFVILTEAQIIADNILEYFLPVSKNIRPRIFSQTLINLTLVAACFVLMTSLSDHYNDVPLTIFYLGLAIGLVFVTLFSTGLLVLRLAQKWVQAQKEMDIMKQEKLKMDYNSLQDKLNPHFLFNNLSVLKSLIIYDQDTAITFTENFTDVYRYVLQSKDKVLVTLTEELSFINAYLGLHKERLGDGLDVKLSIEKDTLQNEIAPLTLQLLVENAIKHNIAGKDSPLHIEIIAKEGYLGVINNLQRKESSYSTFTGLKNLIQRYKMLTENEIEIIENEQEFMVKIPLV